MLKKIISTLKWATIFFLAIFFIGSIANSLIMIGMGPEYGTRTEYEAHIHFMHRTLVCLIITIIITSIKTLVSFFMKTEDKDATKN